MGGFENEMTNPLQRTTMFNMLILVIFWKKSLWHTKVSGKSAISWAGSYGYFATFPDATPRRWHQSSCSLCRRSVNGDGAAPGSAPITLRGVTARRRIRPIAKTSTEPQEPVITTWHLFEMFTECVGPNRAIRQFVFLKHVCWVTGGGVNSFHKNRFLSLMDVRWKVLTD